MLDLEFTFSGKIWIFSGTKASWHMVTVPNEISSDIKAFTKHLAKSFRSVKVTAAIGTTTWNTSLFPDSKTSCYFLPLKASIRKNETIGKDGEVTVHLTIRT